MARKAAWGSRVFTWFLGSKGDQRPFAVESLQRALQRALQPALDVSEVIYKSGAGELIALPFTVDTFCCHHWAISSFLFWD